MSRLTRTLALFLFAFSLFLGSVQPVAAGFFDLFRSKTSTQRNVDKTINAILDSENEGVPSHESFVDDNTQNLQTSLFLTIAGPPEDKVGGTSTYSEEEKRILAQRYGRGVIGEVANLTAELFNPPASSRTYVADILESAHVIPEAQAQGLGFSSLDPILETWKVFRNVAYLFFVVIFLVIGFMIMFRQKIGGQTVVTAQQAIPGVIISLIFVTFSYAIAGFLIDLMYLLMYLMIGLFNPEGGLAILSKNFLQLGIDLITGSEGAFVTMNETVKSFADAVLGEGAPSAFVGFIGGLTLALIVSVAILIGVFKIFFELLKSYISIIIAVVTAPLVLMLGAVPGKDNFAQWIKTVAGNLMAFPTVLFALILYEMFTGSGNLENGGFIPPYLIGRGAGGAIVALVGIGIILIIPELIKEVKKAMGADGGIWEQLAGSAVKSAFDGEKAAPYAGATIGAGGGLIRSQLAMEGDVSLGSRLKAAAVGYEDKSTGEVHGGLFTGAKRGWDTGQKVMDVSQSIRQGKTPQFVRDQKWLKELQNRVGAGDSEESSDHGADVPDNQA
jgi:hypothetical protein